MDVDFSSHQLTSDEVTGKLDIGTTNVSLDGMVELSLTFMRIGHMALEAPTNCTRSLPIYALYCKSTSE